MTAVITILALAIIMLGLSHLVLVRAVWLSKPDHAKCMAHVASVTSNKFVADRIREMADRYDNVDAQGDLTRIRNARFDGQKSVPALWMREQANLIEGEAVGP